MFESALVSGVDGEVSLEMSCSAADLTVREIQRKIKSGELKPGDRLPDQHELAAEFGLSRPSVREALAALEHLGIIRSVRGQGTYVTDLSLEKLTAKVFFQGVSVDAQTAYDLMEFRLIIEPYLGSKAAVRATVQERERLDQLRCRMREVSDPLEYRQLDKELHMLLIEAGHNSVACSLRPLLTHSALWDRLFQSLTKTEVPDTTRQDHELIVDAVLNRDEELARSILTTHILRNWRTLKAALSALN